MHQQKILATSVAIALTAAGLLIAPLLLTPGAMAAEGPDATATDARMNSLLGFNDHPLDGRAPAEASVMLDRVAGLGAVFVRIDVHWAWLEWQRPGRANWNPDQVRLLESYLDAAHSRG